MVAIVRVKETVQTPIELAPGTRAVAVELGNSTAMVDGLIGQGSFVDV